MLGKSKESRAKQWADWGWEKGSSAIGTGSTFVQSAWGGDPNAATAQAAPSVAPVQGKRGLWRRKKSSAQRDSATASLQSVPPAPAPSRVIWGQRSSAQQQISVPPSTHMPSAQHSVSDHWAAVPAPIPIPRPAVSGTPPSAPPPTSIPTAAYTQPSHHYLSSSTPGHTSYNDETHSTAANQPYSHPQYHPPQPSQPASAPYTMPPPPPFLPHPPAAASHHPYADMYRPPPPSSPPPHSNHITSSYSQEPYQHPVQSQQGYRDQRPDWPYGPPSPPDVDSRNFRPAPDYSSIHPGHHGVDRDPDTRADWELRSGMRYGAPWEEPEAAHGHRPPRSTSGGGFAPVGQGRMPSGHDDPSDGSYAYAPEPSTGYSSRAKPVYRPQHTPRRISRPPEDYYDTEYQTNEDEDEVDPQPHSTSGLAPLYMSRRRASRAAVADSDETRPRQSHMSMRPAHIASRTPPRSISRDASVDPSYYSVEADEKEDSRSDMSAASSLRRPMRSTEAAAFMARRGML